MSRKKRERAVRNHKSDTAAGEPAAVDLRKERPVRRVAGQVAAHVRGLVGRCQTIESWTHPKGRGAKPNPLVVQAHAALCHVVEGFPKFFETMNRLDETGFSPPRKSYTAGTEEGDHITVLESHRHIYSDFMMPELMVDLLVEKTYPGKGGGLVVISKTGDRMKVAKCHAVKLS